LALSAWIGTGVTRADLVTHAVVGYGDVGLTVNEEYGVQHAAAALTYSSPGMFVGNADSSAGFGVLSTTVHAAGDPASYAINRAQSEASFSDFLTISGHSGSGVVIYQYTLTGGASGDSDAHAFLGHGNDPDEELAEEAIEGGSFTSLPHAFTFGAPFRTSLVLSTIALVAQGQSSESDANFQVMLSGFFIFDADMNPISDFSVGSQSGTQYPLPAPASIFIIAVATVPRRSRR
jgi:hypothetical protein